MKRQNYYYKTAVMASLSQL